MSTHPPEKHSPDAGKSEEQLKREFARRLRRLREARGQTQSQVAKALGFASESVYQLWEGSGNLPSAFNLHKLARYFQVSTDYLLGLPGEQREVSVEREPQEDQEESRKLEVFKLALQGKDWDAPELASLLRALRRSSLESLEQCYERVITDVTYPSRSQYLPRLEDFYTPAARQAKEEIERLFRQRPFSDVRRVTLYVLDLGDVPSRRLQRIILGMQGAALIKQRRMELSKQGQTNFTLGISNGRMTRDVLLAPNMARGDIQDVEVIPLVLGKSQSDTTAASSLIGHFVFDHGDYGVKRGVYLKDRKASYRIKMVAGGIDLAFMGVGSLEPDDPKSLFAKLLAERGLVPEELRAKGIIGNILFHFIREEPFRPSWEVYHPPEGQQIRVDIDDPAGDETLHTIGLDVLRELVEFMGTPVVMIVKDPSRAKVVRAALEMRWANTVICSLAVARDLLKLLAPTPAS